MSLPHDDMSDLIMNQVIIFIIYWNLHSAFFTLICSEQYILHVYTYIQVKVKCYPLVAYKATSSLIRTLWVHYDNVSGYIIMLMVPFRLVVCHQLGAFHLKGKVIPIDGEDIFQQP